MPPQPPQTPHSAATVVSLPRLPEDAASPPTAACMGVSRKFVLTTHSGLCGAGGAGALPAAGAVLIDNLHS